MTLNPIKPGLKGNIFDIQGLSVHDGPGCRTLIFMKGCSLHCSWCSNPEGISSHLLPIYFRKKCIGCGQCAEACQWNAITIRDGTLSIDRDLCARCDNRVCAEHCFTDALKLSGYEISVSKLFDIIRRDRQFWGVKGGVTLTGGEPLLQPDFAQEILSLCYDAYIHTAVETCGNVPWDHFQKIIPFTDWIFFDLKNFNTVKHMEATGAGNHNILDNAGRLTAEFNGRLIFRVPLIPGFNDSEENLDELIAFLHKTGRNEVNLLPLHHLGREKYALLEKQYSAINFAIPDPQHQHEIKRKFDQAGIKCYLGSDTPF